MSSSIWYLYEFVRKKWLKRFANAKTEKEAYVPPKRYRKIPVIIDQPDNCISCNGCYQSCPSEAIEMRYSEEYGKVLPVFFPGSCISCGNCVETCPTGVLEQGTLRKEAKEYNWTVPKINNYVIDDELCVKCDSCKRTCPVNAITYDNNVYRIKTNDCVGCNRCATVCPVEGAIKVYNEYDLSEKINRAQNLKFLKKSKKIKYETFKNNTNDNDNVENNEENNVSTDNGVINDIKHIIVAEEYKPDSIAEIPRIVPSLCIKCNNCTDVCPGKIDLDSLEVLDCVKCGLCIEVCPTTAIRTGTVVKKTLNTENCYIVNEDKCIGCRICSKACNVENAISISLETNMPYINPYYCVRCGLCHRECPVDAIDFPETLESEKLSKYRSVRNNFQLLIEKDLEDYAKNYVIAKDEILEKGKKELNL
ncbi:energy-converting hydrogenase A subunit P [Methanococcus voltae PS]|uniref:Energy-converting hydrogenase A subunit P n=1 Tax=Methanococcus voltae PS TaxID=523842 RepID=A0ABT2EX19_METVO|nr:4Fe-4S binding protein [Methanococcus voltae]MCS3922506.1 energy-converting hydrogenase A subunit P [Methanococcus voltae PS]